LEAIQEEDVERSH